MALGSKHSNLIRKWDKEGYGMVPDEIPGYATKKTIRRKKDKRRAQKLARRRNRKSK